MYHLPVEATISRVNIFLQHWGSPTILGNSLRCTLELLQLETGLATCPLFHPFDVIGPLCTRSWIRSFWECIDYYKVTLRLNYPAIPLPRDRDKVLISLALERGLRGDALRSFQRCRIACGLLFLSDMTTADGKYIDRCLLSAPGASPSTGLSKYNFPTEQPGAQDWDRWKAFWEAYTGLSLSLPIPLGNWTADSHRLWEWRYDPLAETVQRVCGGVVWLYSRDATESTRRT
jgi:hypothetical protein